MGAGSSRSGGRTPRVPKPTLAAVILRQVREQIVSGQIPPGAQLNEGELAARFATSRGPIREGLQRLVQEGLLVSTPHRGLFVPVLTAADLEDRYLARAALERAAMLRIVEQGISAAAIAELEQVLGEMELALREGDTTGIAEADLRFHEVIVLRSGSERLGQMYRMLAGQTRLGLNVLAGVYEHREDLLAEHRRILKDLIAGERGPVLERLDDHFDSALKTIAGTLDPPIQNGEGR